MYEISDKAGAKVMDLQKEREAFEQHLTDTGLVEFSDYGFAVDECDCTYFKTGF